MQEIHRASVPLPRPNGVEYATKLVLISLYLGIFGMVALTQNLEPRLGALDLVVLGLAVFRLGRLVAYDRVFEPLRAPFTSTVMDQTGAGETVEPKGTGVRRTIGQLVSCPICAGTWVSALLIYGLYLLPGPTRLLMWLAAAVGAAQVLGALVEALSWTGELARTRAGAISLERRDREQHYQEQIGSPAILKDTNRIDKFTPNDY